jgi:hypothetical protein
MEDVEAELAAAMADPLLQDLVERAVDRHLEHRTDEGRREARRAILADLATDPEVEQLLQEIRSGGGRSHVVEFGSAGAPRAARRQGGGQRVPQSATHFPSRQSPPHWTELVQAAPSGLCAAQVPWESGPTSTLRFRLQ